MTHKNAIYAFDRTISDFDNKDTYFGSRNIIFAGDFRQIPSVIKSGTKEDVINATVKFFKLWKYFQKFQLTVALVIKMIIYLFTSYANYKDYKLDGVEGQRWRVG